MISVTPGGLYLEGPMLWSLMWYLLAIRVALIWIARHAC